MVKNKFGKIIIPGVYLLAVFIIIGSIATVVISLNKYFQESTDYNYSVDGVFDKTVPVLAETTSIIRPYLSQEVKIGKYFYDFEGDNEEQVKSIIYYENTYMQNSGVDYISDKAFDVVAILDGEIAEIEQDETLGTIIHIKHDNDLISVYQGISNLSLKKGDKVVQSDILGTSGTSKINPEYKNVLHFEMYYKGEMIDPENIYSLSVEDFQ